MVAGEGRNVVDVEALGGVPQEFVILSVGGAGDAIPPVWRQHGGFQLGELRIPFTSGIVKFGTVPKEVQEVSILVSTVFASTLALWLDLGQFARCPSPKVHDGGEPCFVFLVDLAKGATEGVRVEVRVRTIEVRSGGSDLSIPGPGGYVAHLLAEVLPGDA